MSETLKARRAAVLVGHGERGGERLNTALRGHRDAVAAALPGCDVTAGVLSGEPAFELALACAADGGDHDIIVYPFFMSAGYFVNVAIPKRIADAGLTSRCRILTPLGADPRLVPLMLRDALAGAAALAEPPAQCRMLLAGHGSQGSRASADATHLAAQRLAATATFAAVEAAFLEEAPFLPDALAADTRPTIVLGFFSGEGLHAAEDVPQALAAAPGVTIYTGAIGAAAGIDTLIRDAITAPDGITI